MRYGLVSAAFIAMSFTAVLSTGALAQQYCGFVNKAGAIVECGYTSREACKNATGKGAMCFVSPDVGLERTLLSRAPLRTG